MPAILRKLRVVIALLVAATTVCIAICKAQSAPANAKTIVKNIPAIDGDSVSSNNGESLFKANCTSCHKIDLVLIGPALRGVRERMQDTLIVKFLLYPKQTVQ